MAHVWRRAAALCVVALCTFAAPPLALAQGGADAASDRVQEDYKQHMSNGVKLFQDKNYEAALAEFEAAYRLKPKASPLVNIALCQKALFRYPKAVAALELALAKHRDTMDPSDEASARQAIAEMRALLARVTVQLSPPHAVLLVGGEEQPPAAGAPAITEPFPTSGPATRVVELGPGTHRIGARAEGYAAAEETVTVVSGEVDRTLKLSLSPDRGHVTVEAGDPQTAIAIDQQFAAYGRWAGFLLPGAHVVQLSRSGAVLYSGSVVVAAGKAQVVGPGRGGLLPAGSGPAVTTPIALVPPPPQPAPLRPARRGPFVLGVASLLWPLDHPEHFPDPEPDFGGAGALRVGYRVNTTASFDAMLQYVNIAIHAKSSESRYTFEAGRFGLNLRLMTSGQTARFVGSLGGGASYDSVRFSIAPSNDCPAEECFDASGLDPFLLVDLGVELDFGGPLLGLALESYFQSSRGIDDADDHDLYYPRALVHLGGSLRVGYGLW